MANVPASAIHTATLPGINREWAKLREYGTLLSWKRGTHFQPYIGEKSFYYLEAGSLIIMHGAANGQIRNMFCMREGSLVNLAYVLGSALTPFRDDSCNFYCLTDVSVRKFPGSLLESESFISEHPALILNLMQSLGVRLLLMHNNLASSGSGDATARLARFCLNMCESCDGQSEIASGISLTELANLLGMHRVSLFRAARKLKNEGALARLDGDKIVVADIEILREFALN